MSTSYAPYPTLTARFLIVGAYGVNLYTDPRATGEIIRNKKATGRPKDLADLASLDIKPRELRKSYSRDSRFRTR